MSRRTRAILVTSHLLLVLAGAALALQSGLRPGFFQQESTATKLGKTSRAPGSDAHGKPFFPTRDWRGSEYARAWKAVANGKHTTRERIRLQRDLLEAWAEVDLAAAIEAALGEAWDRDGGGYYDPCGPLLDVFSEALAKNPQQGWDMIRGRQFGVGTGMLRRVWMEAVGAGDPLFLAGRLPELSWRDRELAVDICRRAVRGRADAVTQAELFKVLASFPPEMVDAEQLMDFASLPAGPVDLPALKEEIIRPGSGDDRMARVNAMLLGTQLALESADEVEAEVDGLPDGVREEVVWAAFRNSEKMENVPGLADLLVEEGAWARLRDPETVRQLQKAARSGGAAEVAGWATTLPVREETTELFDRCVEPYLAENLKTARDWLAEMPPGAWRDRACAEYSRLALTLHANTRASRWALNQITDADFKNEAEDLRSQWEKKTGWTGK